MDGWSRRALLVGSGTAATTAAMARRLGPSAGNPAIEQAVTAAMAAGACPGAMVAMTRNGATLLSHGFGLANIETQSPVTERSVFRIASLTKQFTAAAIIKLSAIGRIDLGAAAADYLPAFARLQRFSLLELMNHTAGLHSDEGDDAQPASAPPARTQIQLAEEIAAQPRPFDFDPGTAWLYSNANYVVLGAVVEQVVGKPFANAMAELIFRPLGLSSAAIDRPADVVLGRVSGYSAIEEPAKGFANAAFIDVSQAGGAGAMRARAIDLCRWHEALLGGRLFDRAHVDRMLTPGRLRDGRLSGAHRFSADDAHYGDVEYACGLLISGPSDPHRSIFHYGAINGFAGLLQSYPEKGLTFTVLCNADIGPKLPFSAIRKAVLSAYL